MRLGRLGQTAGHWRAYELKNCVGKLTFEEELDGEAAKAFEVLVVKPLAQDIEPETIDIMTRIEAHTSVIGILYIKNKNLKICTVPVTMAQVLIVRLPTYSLGVHHALKEIDVLDDMITYRIGTKHFEIMVAAGEEYTACVVHRVRKSKHKKVK